MRTVSKASYNLQPDRCFVEHQITTTLSTNPAMKECIFCKIVAGESPSQKVYSDDLVTAFRDLHPVAPTHILIIPNKHIPSMNDVTPEDIPLLGHMLALAPQIASGEGIRESGYRLIINTGPHGGQVVYHLHLHLIGGQRMRYPMG
jgi:histidine triad (HIT) family protein